MIHKVAVSDDVRRRSDGHASSASFQTGRYPGAAEEGEQREQLPTEISDEGRPELVSKACMGVNSATLQC